MNSSLTFIELSGYLEPPLGFPNGPYFNEHLWPLFLTNLDSIERVLVFRHRSWDINKKVFESGERVSPNIADIGPMERLSNKLLKGIESRSFFGGHLNVLYQIAATNPMLTQLFRLYPQPGKLSSEETDSLGIERAEREELAEFVHSIPSSYVLVSFAHDADPLYIFGSPNTLNLLQESPLE